MLWIVLIPLLPLAAFLTLALFGRFFRERSHRVSIAALAVSFFLSIAALGRVYLEGPGRVDLYPFIRSGELIIDIGLYLDPLSALMILLVSGVSTLVHIFSSRYMIGDPRYTRFFAVLSLYSFTMLMLVMSTNLLMIYLFWEVMGICSFLLNSHCAERKEACESALRAFLVNAVADVGLGLGIFLTFATFGTLDLQEVLAQAPGQIGRTVNLLGWMGLHWPVERVGLIALLFLIGAMGKSAQVPFHIWLPFTMEAPTPVSALGQAATLVKAGIFLVIRLSPLFLLSPAAMNLMVVVGGTTALMAAVVAVTQSDIKKILAYSTISQIGFMLMLCGAGAYAAAVFHLLAHGALKAFLFLSSGSALQGLAESRRPGHPAGEEGRAGIRPWYAAAFTLAWLPSILLVLSNYGFLWRSARTGGLSAAFWMMALALSFLASISLFRWVTGLGQPHPAVAWEPRGIGREAFRTLTGPVGVGAVWALGALAVGVWAVPLGWLWRGFAEFLAPSIGPGGALIRPKGEEGALSLTVLLLGIGVATAGWSMARYRMTHPHRPSPAGAVWSKRLYILVRDKFYLDEICDAFIVRPNLRLARWLWESVDVWIIEGLVLGSGGQTVRFARWLWQSVDIRGLNGLVAELSRWTVGLARWLWKSVDIRGLERFIARFGRQNRAAGEVLQEIQPSLLQHHLLVMIFILVVAMGLFLFFLL